MLLVWLVDQRLRNALVLTKIKNKTKNCCLSHEESGTMQEEQRDLISCASSSFIVWVRGAGDIVFLGTQSRISALIPTNLPWEKTPR